LIAFADGRVDELRLAAMHICGLSWPGARNATHLQTGRKSYNVQQATHQEKNSDTDPDGEQRSGPTPLITSRPPAVGPMTSAMLMQNTLRAALLKTGRKPSF
jgi:5,10-methylene-tetrahydrofolate dehydrogenase/methenyl tetrahydrofolate cyclohydrolase